MVLWILIFLPLLVLAQYPAVPLETESFSKGVSLFQNKNYSDASPFFSQAILDNPQNGKAYYYLGYCQVKLGNLSDAALDFYLADLKTPDPRIKAYADQLKAKLSPDVQKWVDQQLSLEAMRPAHPAGENFYGQSNLGVVVTPAPFKNYGIRIGPSFKLFNLSDFTANSQSLANAASQQQASDPTVSYQSSAIPSSAIAVCIEPLAKVNANLEIGLPIGYARAGTISDSYQVGSANYKGSTSFGINVISVGLNVRYLFGNGKVQPFLSGGAMFIPVNIDYMLNLGQGGAVTTRTGTFSSIGAGVQASMGVDLRLWDWLAISPSVGYQISSASGFAGTYTRTTSSGSTAQFQGVLEVVPTPYGNQIVLFPTNSTFPPGSRTLQIDLSGLTTCVQASFFF